ncbi:MAG: family 43 glycosylhydrolase [Bacteroidota bacterium]
MLFTKRSLLLSLICFKSIICLAQNSSAYNAIYSGTPWFDDNGKVVSAHGANIVKDKGRYYLFGEAHTDTSNVFAGFNCYSSPDLYNWKFESLALPAQLSGKLGPNRIGERPKVMKCPATGEYVMYMHVDTMGYKDQFVGYATSKTIAGPYTFRGALLFDGKPIRKWDMGTFQDRDGAGYVLLHGGDIYKLGKDFKSISEQVNKSFTPGFESPAIFRKGNLYYLLGSNLTSWEKNDNYYYTATSLAGPWRAGGLFCPKGTLTWNSQTTFVLPIEGAKDTTYMFMGDRWSYPKQASAATYVWQPFSISGTAISIPNYQQGWTVNLSTGLSSPVEAGTSLIDNSDKKQIRYLGKWQPLATNDSIASSNEKGAGFLVEFNGQQIGLVGLLQPQGGYARVEIRDSKKRIVLSTLIDTYCKYQAKGLLFLTPKMPKGKYSLALTISGEHGVWTDKSKRIYGSTDNYFSLDKVFINR